MKYRAFINFTHNGVKIKGGEVFDSVEVGFTTEDINFLKEQGKIETVSIFEKNNQPVVDNLRYIYTNDISTDSGFTVEENKVPFVRESIPNVYTPIPEINYPPEEPDEPLVQEIIDTRPDYIVEIKEEPEVLPWEKPEESENKSSFKESDLAKMNKTELIKIAEKLNIKTEGKTKKELISEISLLINQLE